ncbi:hypothetical protein OHR68_20790 [Spirillospora sp. NBC_00431]
MGPKKMEQRCHRLIARLELPDPFDLEDFIGRLERRRSRPVRLIASKLPSGVICGAWIRTARTDYIYYEEGTTGVHKQHIILHEIGHMLLDHKASSLARSSVADLLLPDLDPALVKSVLGRTSYSSKEEVEAEAFADLLSLAIKPKEEPGGAPGSPATAGELEIVARLERALLPDE